MEEYIVRVYEDRTEWYQNEKLHRVDGPAIEYVNGDKFWYLNGDRHRTDGPAVEYANEQKWWYLNGEQYTEKDFLKKTSPVKELTVEEISKLLGFEVKVVKG